MAGIFDLKKGAFDSSEAGRLYKAYDIALQGLRATHEVDQHVVHRLARSIVKVARSESDCLDNEGKIDPVRLAQRAILRMLQLSAPSAGRDRAAAEESISPPPSPTVEGDRRASGDSAARVMLRLFDRTNFAKL